MRIWAQRPASLARLGRRSTMKIRAWNERYRSRQRPAEDLDAAPTPLLIQIAAKLPPGRALDLACGAGRNALWLAANGWSVTAVDGASSAIRILRDRASARKLQIDARVADLEQGEYEIAAAAWDLVVIGYYLQRDLFAPAKQSLAPGGILLAIVHITEPGEEPTSHRLRPGELKQYFQEWEILHDREGSPGDAAHKRLVAEIVARKPGSRSDSRAP
jgi:SAM-dependent methyltransferase